MTHINQGIALSFAEACNCNFTVAHIVDQSVILKCRDNTSAEISLEIQPVKEYSAFQLICQFHKMLVQHRNVIDLGKFLS